jgi:hypothetical protein
MAKMLNITVETAHRHWKRFRSLSRSQRVRELAHTDHSQISIWVVTEKGKVELRVSV